MLNRRRSEAELELGEYFDVFREAINVGNRHFWIKYKDDAHRITSISRAGLIRCFIADELRKRLDSRRGIHIQERQQTTFFNFGINWLVQVHKLDEASCSAVNTTQRSLALNENDLHAIDLPDIPDSATVLFLGYIENIGDHLAPEMRLTCPNGYAPAWVIDLGDAEPPPSAEITPPEGPTGPSDGTKVVVRKQDRNFGQ